MVYGRLAAGLVAALSAVLVASAAICGDLIRRGGGLGWASSPADVAAFIEHDGATLMVKCDTSGERAIHPDSRGLILIFFVEPGASWQKYGNIDVTTVSDTGRQWPPSKGTAIRPTAVVVKNGATLELVVMGAAKESFTISAGGYTRTFPAANLREAVKPVLNACGDDWPSE